MGRVMRTTFSGVVLVLARELLTAGFVVPVTSNRRSLPPPLSSALCSRGGAKPRSSCCCCGNAINPASRTHTPSSWRASSRTSRPRLLGRGIAVPCCATATSGSEAEGLNQDDERPHGAGDSCVSSSAAVMVTGNKWGKVEESHDHEVAGGPAANGFEHERGKATPSEVGSLRGTTTAIEGCGADMGESVAFDVQAGRDSGTPWTEFEDWLLQDTYARLVPLEGGFGDGRVTSCRPLDKLKGAPSPRP